MANRPTRPKRPRPRPVRPPGLPTDIAEIVRELERFFDLTDETGRKPADAKCGIYVLFDYDGEPIYVGQTSEKLRVRIRRHLTNQRTDAVAMSVLDPLEVAEVEIYPFWDLEKREGESTRAFNERVKEPLARAEYTVFKKVITNSTFGTTLNEKLIAFKPEIALPPSVRVRIVPDTVYNRLHHPDIRIARRASTLANLAKVISERDVSPGLRNTLLTQARRLKHLARQRFESLGGTVPEEQPGEETGEETEDLTAE